MKQITFLCLYCNKRYLFASLDELYKFKREYYIVDSEGVKTRNAICNECYPQLFKKGEPDKKETKKLYELSGHNPDNLQAIEWDENTLDKKVLSGEIKNKKLKVKIKWKIQMPVVDINQSVYDGLVEDLLAAGCTYKELSDCAKDKITLAELVDKYLDYS